MIIQEDKDKADKLEMISMKHDSVDSFVPSKQIAQIRQLPSNYAEELGATSWYNFLSSFVL